MAFARWTGGFALGLALLLPITALARTWHVAPDVFLDAPTIQAAIESCASGDTVLVAASTYFANINFLGKSICVRSASGPEATVINGNNQVESTVLFVTGETRYSVLDGFTITGGRGHLHSDIYTSGYHGGGIYIDNSSPLIRNCIIRGNQAKFGGGVHLSGENAFNDPSLVAPQLDGNTIIDNTAEWGGGGLSMFFGEAVITNNRFANNTATEEGGGVYLWLRNGSALISHNQFWENQAVTGGGLFAAFRDFTVTFNLFAQNTATGDANEGAGGGAAFYNTHEALIGNNTFVQNVGGSPNQCLGGAFTLRGVWSVQVTRNIIAMNSGCGVYCTISDSAPIAYVDNLIWANSGGRLVGCGDMNESWVIADPQFCGAASGDYTVSSTSPAFGPGGPMGAFTLPGCGITPVRKSTWGLLKSRAWQYK